MDPWLCNLQVFPLICYQPQQRHRIRACRLFAVGQVGVVGQCVLREQYVGTVLADRCNGDSLEMAGVRMPSPTSAHVPSSTSISRLVRSHARFSNASAIRSPHLILLQAPCHRIKLGY